jgi:hypothetical protein
MSAYSHSTLEVADSTPPPSAAVSERLNRRQAQHEPDHAGGNAGEDIREVMGAELHAGPAHQGDQAGGVGFEQRKTANLIMIGYRHMFVRFNPR